MEPGSVFHEKGAKVKRCKSQENIARIRLFHLEKSRVNNPFGKAPDSWSDTMKDIQGHRYNSCAHTPKNMAYVIICLQILFVYIFLNTCYYIFIIHSVV